MINYKLLYPSTPWDCWLASPVAWGLWACSTAPTLIKRVTVESCVYVSGRLYGKWSWSVSLRGWHWVWAEQPTGWENAVSRTHYCLSTARPQTPRWRRATIKHTCRSTAMLCRSFTPSQGKTQRGGKWANVFSGFVMSMNHLVPQRYFRGDSATSPICSDLVNLLAQNLFQLRWHSWALWLFVCRCCGCGNLTRAYLRIVAVRTCRAQHTITD